MMVNYRKDLEADIAAIDALADDKNHEWFTRDSEEYKSIRKEYESRLSSKNIGKYRENLIGTALEDYERWNASNISILTGAEADPSLFAHFKASDFAKQVEMQKIDLNKQFSNTVLTASERKRLEAIIAELNSFDVNEYE